MYAGVCVGLNDFFKTNFVIERLLFCSEIITVFEENEFFTLMPVLRTLSVSLATS